MPNTFVTYKEDKGFWLAESFAQLLLYYIFEEISKPETISREITPFESIRRTNPAGNEFWSSRDLLAIIKQEGKV
jgi:hypothetical protein